MADIENGRRCGKTPTRHSCRVCGTVKYCDREYPHHDSKIRKQTDSPLCYVEYFPGGESIVRYM